MKFKHILTSHQHFSENLVELICPPYFSYPSSDVTKIYHFSLVEVAMDWLLV